MKKENPLTIWSFPYNKRYYLIHPWKLAKDIYWNIRNFWHRGRFGYAYVDVWNFCNWYPRVGAEALRYLALHKHGWPACKPWKTSEEWTEYLNYLANRLQRCADSQDILFGEERNEYHDAYEASITKAYREEKGKDGLIHSHYDFTPEDDEIRKKYWERDAEIRKADHQYIIDTYKMLADDLERLWD